MDEYISREELRKHLKQCYDDELFDADMKNAVIGIDIYVENMPTADVQPVKHGRWIRHGKPEDYFWNCSECKNWIIYAEHDLYKHHFCGNCGAKLTKDGDSE